MAPLTFTSGPARAEIASAAAGSTKAILLYPTIMGVNADMRRFAAEFAANGMNAVVWDPYRGQPTGDSLPEMIERSKTITDDDAVGDLCAITDHIQAELGVDQIGAIGWCFGGRIGLLHAGLDDRVRSLCSYNPTMLSVTPVEVAGVGVTSRADHPGQTMDEMALARQISGPVQVARPEHDFTHASQYQSLLEALFKREQPTFYEYYPEAVHGFSYTPGEANERAHRLAWARTLSLLSGPGV